MAVLYLPAEYFFTPASSAAVQTPVFYSDGSPNMELQYTATQHAYCKFDTSAYSSSASLKIRWKANATTGNCQWECAILAHAVGAGSSLEAHSFATAQNVTTTTAGTANDVTESTISITNLDSLTNAKVGRLRVSRIGGTLAVTANLIECFLTLT